MVPFIFAMLFKLKSIHKIDIAKGMAPSSVSFPSNLQFRHQSSLSHWHETLGMAHIRRQFEEPQTKQRKEPLARLGQDYPRELVLVSQICHVRGIALSSKIIEPRGQPSKPGRNPDA